MRNLGAWAANGKEKYQEYFRHHSGGERTSDGAHQQYPGLSPESKQDARIRVQGNNLADLVRSTWISYRFQIEQNGFAFEGDICTDIPPVTWTVEAIARSLLNLGEQPLKYSKDQKYIGVSLYRANSRVNLEVRDRGIGIPPNEQEKIFESFIVVGIRWYTTSRLGMGLSLVRHIARAHGGMCWSKAHPRKGANSRSRYHWIRLTDCGAAA